MFDDHASQLNPALPVQDEGFDVFAPDGGRSDVAAGRSQPLAGFPLSLARDKDLLTITAMRGGRHYRRQLMDMGLRPGQQIRVMRAGGRGPVLISVGETRLGLGRSMADQIEVAPVSLDCSSGRGGR